MLWCEPHADLQKAMLPFGKIGLTGSREGTDYNPVIVQSEGGRGLYPVHFCTPPKPYENEPLVKVFNQLITDRPGGGFWAYEDLKSEGARILGFPPFSTTNDLKYKLDSPLARELQERDGMIISHSQKGAKGARGIRIEQYHHPSGYQMKMSTEEGNDC